jgi:hypothetical protein
VTITATDPSVLDTLHAAVSYSFNNGGFVSGLPDALSIADGLSFTGDFDQKTGAGWVLFGIADLEQGTYVIRATVTDDNGGIGHADTSIVVNVLGLPDQLRRAVVHVDAFDQGNRGCRGTSGRGPGHYGSLGR